MHSNKYANIISQAKRKMWWCGAVVQQLYTQCNAYDKTIIIMMTYNSAELSSGGCIVTLFWWQCVDICFYFLLLLILSLSVSLAVSFVFPVFCSYIDKRFECISIILINKWSTLSSALGCAVRIKEVMIGSRIILLTYIIRLCTETGLDLMGYTRMSLK